MPIRRLLPVFLVLSAASAMCAHAGVPLPYDPARFSFPGAVASPADGASAALALADHWISARTGGNPAAAPVRSGVVVSPMLLRIDRQDLGSQNSEFSQTTAFVEAAGARVAWRRGAWGVTLHATQPAVRRETSTFNVGLFEEVISPARVQIDASHREARAGLGVSTAKGGWRFGVSGEWVSREDRMTTVEASGSPDAGQRELRFDGTAVAGAIGVLWSSPDAASRPITVGVALRSIGALSVEGQSVTSTFAEDATVAIQAERDAVSEVGASIRVGLGSDTGVWGMVGRRGPERWSGFDVATGATTAWRIGIEHRGAETPWSVRAGYGSDTQPGTPEPRASVLGVGLGWDAGDLGFDLGITHRSMRRGDLPTQHDDRLVGSVVVEF